LENPIRSFFQTDRVLNLTYRGITILSKFLLSILIVKKLDISELGVFGIFQTTITLLVYVLGFDFYTYNAREILKEKANNISFFVGNQLVFHGLVYCLVLPLSLLLFTYNVVATEYLIYFYLLLITEHLSQEIYRILIVLKKSVVASFTLLLRSGLWVLLIYMLWNSLWTDQKLTDIFLLWFFGAFFSIMVGLSYIKPNFNYKVDWSWIKKGLKIATPFFIATIFYKVIEFSGRYFLDFYWTKNEVGVFSFFSSISNALFVLVHSTVIIVMSPYLIAAANESNKAFRLIYRKFANQVFLTAGAGSLLAAVGIIPLLNFMDNPQLDNNIAAYFLLLLAVVFFCLSYIPHYALYAYHSDKQLLYASVIGAGINVLMNFMVVPKYGVYGASFVQALSMIALLIAKGIMLQRSSYAKSQ